MKASPTPSVSKMDPSGSQWIPVGSDLGDLGKTALLDPVGYDLVIFSVYFPIYWTYWNIGNISGMILIHELVNPIKQPV